MLTGILKPTEGKITVLDHEIEKMNDRQLSVLRGGDLGYIMQGQNLLQNLTVMENILLPLSLGKNRKPDKERITYLTELLGIQNMLSGKSVRRRAKACVDRKDICAEPETGSRR